jgi:hypothetical protein
MTPDDQMSLALFKFCHEAMHGHLARLVESGSGPSSLEADLLGPLAMEMFYGGLSLALRYPAEAALYREQMRGIAPGREAVERTETEDIDALAAATRRPA